MYITALPLTSEIISLTSAEVISQTVQLNVIKKKDGLLRDYYTGQTPVGHHSGVNQNI